MTLVCARIGTPRHRLEGFSYDHRNSSLQRRRNADGRLERRPSVRGFGRPPRMVRRTRVSHAAPRVRSGREVGSRGPGSGSRHLILLDRVLCCLVRRIDQNDLVQVVSVGSLCCTFDELTRTTPDRSFQLVRSNQRRGITPAHICAPWPEHPPPDEHALHSPTRPTHESQDPTINPFGHDEQARRGTHCLILGLRPRSACLGNRQASYPAALVT
jgi:hypothetical protein